MVGGLANKKYKFPSPTLENTLFFTDLFLFNKIEYSKLSINMLVMNSTHYTQYRDMTDMAVEEI